MASLTSRQKISFENFNTINTPLASPFVVNGSSFYSVGLTPNSAPATYEIQAVFAGNDTFEAVASGPVSYETSETNPGQGASGDESIFVGDVGTTFNNPPEFANLCANLATGAGDADLDGICDVWEVGTTLTPAGQAIGTGNVALIKCPQKNRRRIYRRSQLELQLLTATL